MISRAFFSPSPIATETYSLPCTALTRQESLQRKSFKIFTKRRAWKRNMKFITIPFMILHSSIEFQRQRITSPFNFPFPPKIICCPTDLTTQRSLFILPEPSVSFWTYCLHTPTLPPHFVHYPLWLNLLQLITEAKSYLLRIGEGSFLSDS